jgi:excinuclease ABC subunit B
MYADRITDSMKAAIAETDRRRQVQQAYNAEHGIVPTTIIRAVQDVMEGARTVPESAKRGRKGAAAVAEEGGDYSMLDPAKLVARVKQLEAQMYQHARDLEFEQAARLRDELQKVKALAIANPL